MLYTTSPGAAAALIFAGFPLQEAAMGERGRVRFRFPEEAGETYAAYQRANAEVHAALDRARRRGVHDGPQT
jgi:hypothetical protein